MALVPDLKEPGAVKPASVCQQGNKMTSTTNWFTSEIQQMMFGFGDCRRPLHDTAVLVEEIVHEQMTQVLNQATEVAIARSSHCIGMEDLVFLLRKDATKLRRLVRYMDVKDTKAAALMGTAVQDDKAADLEKQRPLRKRTKMIVDFLATIDQTGQLVGVFDDDRVDEIKHERLMRAELRERGMDVQQYLEFCQARQSNFSRRYKSQRFKDWLTSSIHLDLKPNPFALEVLSYLAYETIAQVVDLALIVKQDKRARSFDPAIKHHPHITVNYHDAWLLPSLTARTVNTAQSSLPTVPTTQGQTAGPNITPSISNPGTSGISNSGLASTSVVSSSSASTVKVYKNKKRKKSGPGASMESTMSHALLPSDVREVIRRYGNTIGPFSSMMKVNQTYPPKKRLLCA